jgi:hypothetical protein
MSEPFLPEHAQQQAPQPKQAPRKTVLLWLGIIGLFAVLWFFFNDPKAKMQRLPPCELQDPSIWLALGPVATGLSIFVVLIVVLLWRAYAATGSFNKDCELAAVASAHGDFEQAASLYGQVLQKYKTKPAYVALMHHNIGVMQLSAGRFPEAVASLANVERSRTALFTSGLRTLTCAHLAQTYALAGDLRSAEKWSTEAHQRSPKVTDQNRLHIVAALHFADAIRLCREGKHVDAVAPLLTHWSTLRSTFSAKQMYMVEVLRAFAETHGGIRAHVSEVSRSGSPKELTMLVASWPEMRAFAVTNGWVEDAT